MTKEEKELLLIDLCARLPYNVVVNCTEEDDERTNFNCFLTPDMINDIQSVEPKWIYKPYLRLISSMTDEEINISDGLFWKGTGKLEDWLNANHFDYRGLIGMNLALEATKEMYE